MKKRERPFLSKRREPLWLKFRREAAGYIAAAAKEVDGGVPALVVLMDAKVALDHAIRTCELEDEISAEEVWIRDYSGLSDDEAKMLLAMIDRRKG